MTKMFRHIATAIPCIMICASLNSCIIAMRADEPTKGKKLTEIKEARDKKAISQSEYETQKSKILNDH